MGKGVLSREHILILSLLVSFMMTSAFPLYSQTKPGKIGVASATFRQGDDDSPIFIPVISGIVSFELEQAGFFSTVFREEPGVDRAIEKAAGEGIDLLLANRYTARGNEIVLTFSCYYVPEKQLLAEVSGTGDINLTLDGVIQQMLQEIIEKVESRIGDLPSLATAVDEPEPETAAAAEEPLKVETSIHEGPEDRGQQEPAVISGEIVQSTFDKDKSGKAEKPAGKFRHFEITLGFSPFFPVGGGSSYFTFGLEPWLYTGYRLRIGSSSLTLGAFGGVNIFSAQGVLISSENLLISTGADFRFLSSEEDILRVGFRLAGGAAFLMVNPNDQGYQTAVVPFGSGGLSVDIGLGAIGLGLQFNYSAYFEQSVVIMGFSPGLQISLRL